MNFSPLILLNCLEAHSLVFKHFTLKFSVVSTRASPSSLGIGATVF
jgi:hypothetical protein